MEWFASFYTTRAMVGQGFKVRMPVYDAEYNRGVRPAKFGDEYILSDQEAQYQIDLDDYKELLEECKDEAERNEINQLRRPLQPWTWSLKVGPLVGNVAVHQVDKFDSTTLLKIVVAHLDEISADDLDLTRASLVARVKQLVDEETVDNGIQQHKVLTLMTGVLSCNNWTWLSAKDRAKFVEAHGVADINGVLLEQVKMLTELCDRYKDPGFGDFDYVRAYLEDSKTTLGILVQDSPETNKRQRTE